jgi:hypothetical protein
MNKDRPMTELRRREARAEDQAAIRDVTIAAYQEHASVMQAHWEDYRQRMLATLANVNPAEQIFAEQGDAIAGTVRRFPAGPVPTTPDGAPVNLP